MNATSAEAPVLPLVPFTRATFRHREPANVDVSTDISTNAPLLGPYNIPSYGFLSDLILYVQATGGAAGLNNAVAKEDAPWSALNEVTLQDVNGAAIVQVSGYDLFLINKYGGYSGFSDPASSPAFSAVATSGNFAFILRVPVEISSRDGLGSMPNMNSQQSYKLRIIQAAQGDIYSTAPDTKPTLRVRAWASEYAPPLGTNAEGQAQAVNPPAVNTTQFWTYQTFPIVSGQNVIELSRVGNVIRNLILVFRNTSDGLRSTTNYPDPMRLDIDKQPMVDEARTVRQHLMRERLVGQTNGPDTGVFVYDHTSDFDGLYGAEMRDDWLKTKGSTRLEFTGSFGAAGTLRVLTNDLAIVGNPYLG